MHEKIEDFLSSHGVLAIPECKAAAEAACARFGTNIDGL